MPFESIIGDDDGHDVDDDAPMTTTQFGWPN